MVSDIAWRAYDLTEDDTVVGDVLVSEKLRPRDLKPRHLLVSLPPSYEGSDRRYPVVYAHDAQNLFDERTSNSGEWRVDETMAALSDEGLEAIVVGIPHGGRDRGYEYAPFPHEAFGGGGADDYLDFLVSTAKPAVDDRFRTASDRDATGLLGSSLGGLVSLYGFFEYPETFGFAGVMSPAFWWCREEIFDYVESRPYVPGRLYVDVGGNEQPSNPERTKEYLDDATRMVERLREKGYDDELRYVVDEDAVHHEEAWRRRLPDALRFLLPSPLSSLSGT